MNKIMDLLKIVDGVKKPFYKCPWVFYLLSTAGYLGLYFLLIDKISLDYIIYLEPWFRNILFNGFTILKGDFYNYAPSYMYLLALSTQFPFTPIVAIKLLALPVVPLGGVLMVLLAREFNNDPFLGWIGYTLVIFAPTIMINSAYWGQADVFYGVALLAAVTYLIKSKPFAAMVFYGIALSFKAQAVFLAPFLLLLLLKKQVPWKYVLIPPAVFILTCIPVAVMGKSWVDVLSTYLIQANTYNKLTMGAASIWAYFPWLEQVNLNLGLLIGFALCLAAIGIYLFYGYHRINMLDKKQFLMAAVLPLIFMPFFLPKMHDRYFYPAEMLSIALIFADWRTLILPVLLQISAGNMYWADLRRKGALFPIEISATINLVVLVLLIGLCVQATSQKEENLGRIIFKTP